MSEEKIIKIGVLGAGRVVQNRYVEVYRDELKSAKVTFVCDIVKDRADKVAQELGAEPLYDMSKLLASDEVDVVVIATESGNHYQHAMQALQSGKHVVLEKPPALLPEQIAEMENFAKDKNLMLAIVFQNRLNPAMQILKETFDNNRFGKIVLATIRLRWCRYQDYYEDGWHGTWAMDGGVINQQAIHHIDALQWVCGPIEEVTSMQSNALNQLEAEDTTVATARFQNGALGVIEATTAARPEDFEASMSIVGEKGYVAIGGIALNKIDKWKFLEEQEEDQTIPQKYSQEVPTGYGLSHGPMLQEIVNRLLQGDITPPIAGHETEATVRLVHAIYRSAETGERVSLSANELSARLGQNIKEKISCR